MFRFSTLILFTSFLPLAAQAQFPSARTQISQAANQLAVEAQAMAADTYEFYRGWDNAIDADEQAILFNAESFSASTQLFARLANDSSVYAESRVQTNINAAFKFLNRAYKGLQENMNAVDASHGWRNRWNGSRRSPLFGLIRISASLSEIDLLFGQWPSVDSDAFLANANRYVQGPGDAVYMIRKTARGEFEKVAFQDLEAFYAYHQKIRGGRDDFKGYPWNLRATVTFDRLRDLPDGQPLTYTYARGDLMIEGSGDGALRPGLPVLAVDEGGKTAHGASQEEIARLKGCSFTPPRGRPSCWEFVFRVPPQVIRKYGF